MRETIRADSCVCMFERAVATLRVPTKCGRARQCFPCGGESFCHSKRHNTLCCATPLPIRMSPAFRRQSVSHVARAQRVDTTGQSLRERALDHMRSEMLGPAVATQASTAASCLLRLHRRNTVLMLHQFTAVHIARAGRHRRRPHRRLPPPRANCLCTI